MGVSYTRHPFTSISRHSLCFFSLIFLSWNWCKRVSRIRNTLLHDFHEPHHVFCFLFICLEFGAKGCLIYETPFHMVFKPFPWFFFIVFNSWKSCERVCCIRDTLSHDFQTPPLVFFSLFSILENHVKGCFVYDTPFHMIFGSLPWFFFLIFMS